MSDTKDTISASDLDRPISIQSAILTDDGQGGSAVVYQPYYSCRANVQNQPHARGIFRRYFASQLYPTMVVIFQIRYAASHPFDPSMRIVMVKANKTHYYKILGIENPGEANKSLLFLCTEDQARGEP